MDSAVQNASINRFVKDLDTGTSGSPAPDSEINYELPLELTLRIRFHHRMRCVGAMSPAAQTSALSPNQANTVSQMVGLQYR